MADEIVIPISVQAQAAIAQLQQLGDVGVAAFQKLGAAANDISGAADKLGEGLNKTHEGAGKAEGSLKSLAETGTKAFEGLTEAGERFSGAIANISAQGAVGAFTALGSAIEQVATRLGPLGQTIGILAGTFTAVTAGVAGVTFGLLELSKSAAESINSMNELAHAAGTDIGTIAGLQTAFAEAGAGAGQLETAFRVLGFQIANVWPELQRDVRDAAKTIEEDQIKIREGAAEVASSQDQVQSAFIKTEEAALSLASAQRKLEESDISVRNSKLALADAQEKVANAGRNAQAAQLSVEQAEYNLLLAQGGARDKALESQLKERGAEIALAEAKQRQIDLSKERERAILAEKKAELDLANALDQQKQSALTLQKAKIDLNTATREQEQLGDKLKLQNLQLADAQNKLADDQKKSVPAVADALNGIQGSFKKVGDQIDLTGVSVDTLFKAIIDNAGKAAAAAKGLQEAVQPTPYQTLLEIAKAFQTVTEQTERQAIARRALGRGASQQEIELLAKGPAYLEAQVNAHRADAVALQESVEKAEQFRASLAQVEIAFVRLRDAIGISFAPTFAEGFDKIRESLEQNKGQILAWADSIKTNVKPVIDDIFNILSGGQAQTAFGQALVGVAGTLKDIAKALGEIASAIAPILSAINSVVEGTIGWKAAIEGILALGLISWLGGVAEAATKAGTALGLLRGAAAIAGGVAAAAEAVGPGAIVGAGSLIGTSLAAQQKSGLFSPPQGIAEGEQKLADQKAELADLQERLAKQPAVPPGGIDPNQALRNDIGRLSTSIENLTTDLARLKEGAGASPEAKAAADKQGKAAEDQVKAADAQLRASETKEGPGSVSAPPASAPGSVPSGAAPSDAGFRYAPGIQPSPAAARTYSRPPVTQAEIEKYNSDLRAYEDAKRSGNYRASDQPFPPSRGGVTITVPGSQPPTELPGGGQAFSPLGAGGPRVVTPPGAPGFTQPDVSSPLGAGGPRVVSPGEPAGLLPGGIGSVLKPLQEAFSGIGGQLKEAFTPVKSAFEGEGPKIDAAVAKMVSAISTGAAQIEAAAQAVKKGGSSGAPSSGGGGTEAAPASSSSDAGATPDLSFSNAVGSGGFAGGGHVRGPGSGTSDSVPIMASDGEFVMNKSAVDHFGLSTLHAMNRFAKGGVIRLPRLAMGGPISLAHSLMPDMPRLAEGGPVAPRSVGGSASHHVLDLRTDGGSFQVSAERNVVEAMSRSSINGRLTQAGIKPSWYR